MSDYRKPPKKFTPGGPGNFQPKGDGRSFRTQGRPAPQGSGQGRGEGRYGRPAGERGDGFRPGQPQVDRRNQGYRPGGAPAQGRGGAGFSRDGGQVQGNREGYLGERGAMNDSRPRGQRPGGGSYRPQENRGGSFRGDNRQGGFAPRGDNPRQGGSGAPRSDNPQQNRGPAQRFGPSSREHGGFVQDTPERGRFQGRFTRNPSGPRMEGEGPSPASLRFGPGSRPGQPFSRPAQPMNRPERLYGRPAPMAQVVPQRQEEVGEDPASESPSQEESLVNINLLSGRNPIREALKAGHDLEKLLIAKGELTGSAREIVAMAKDAGVMIQAVERTRLDQMTKNHQGMIAFASAYQYAQVEDIMATAQERGEDPFIIILDQITDPHNLGAIIRTASCSGAHGVIVPMHRAVGLTPAAVRASAGAVEHVKVARVTNINQAIKSLQQQKVWVYAADMNGEDYRKVSFQGPCALVIGSEGEGVSPLTLSMCDKRVQIPMRGAMDSLNASVAAGILMYAVFNSRA